MIESIGDWKRTHYSKEISPDFKGEVIVMGWARAIRGVGNIKFIQLADREGYVQILAKKGDVSDELLEKVSSLNREDVIAVKGKVKENKEAPNGFEIIPTEIRILNTAEPIPIDFSGKIETGMSKRIDYRYLDTRNPKRLLTFKILSTVEMAMKIYCFENGFMEINTPKLMSAASESGAELFNVDYFGKIAHLAQSPQLYKQMAMAAGFEKVFEQGPVFRANPSHTSKHDTEYTSFDVEIAYISSVEDVMKFEEDWLVYVITKVKESHGKDIKEHFGFEIEIPTRPFPRITMEEAHNAIGNLEVADDFGELDTEGEKKLGDYVKEKFNHDFVFLTEFPFSARPFYHMKKEDNKKLTNSFDLIYKGMEITTGAQREHRYDILLEQLKEKKLHPKDLKFYLDMFRYGCPPHGGFALSPTRVVMQLLNISNIRDVTFLPRDTERLTP
ncbi:MAG: aspartate--tRNA(Asn) ligase [Nanoarchaeota archaeon]|nr:aspartate--tRNA(Asn) ligase [Nanoarchaeota archaeon]